MNQRGRIEPLDAVRGSAMVLVCLSHAKAHFVSAAPLLYDVCTAISKVATPTFLLLSGLVAGFLLRGNPQQRTSIALIDRGLFLLLVAHVLLGLAELPDVSITQWLFRRATITDVIGLALCAAVLLRSRSMGMLLALGIGGFLLSWMIGMTGSSDSPSLNYLGAMLFHMRSASTSMTDVAAVPHLCIFIFGMALSAYMDAALRTGAWSILALRLVAIGGSMVAVALVGALLWHFSHASLSLDPHVADLLRPTLDPRVKWPPSPAYAMFYGGAGLLMAAVFFSNRPKRLVAPFVRHAAVLGRASLMCFVVQDWLLFVAPRVFGFDRVHAPAFWLAYFAAAVLALYVLAEAWDRKRGNRFLTIGLKRLAQQTKAASSSTASARVS